jgi:hypothetical protein
LPQNREDDWFRQNEAKMLEDARAARLKREQERVAAEAEETRRRLKEGRAS